MTQPPPPSWADGDIRALAFAFTTSERFVATIWGRDLVGVGEDGERKGGVRKVSVKGIEMWIVGKEFPTRSVGLVGIVVGVEQKDDYLIYYLDDSTSIVKCTCPLDSPSISSLYNPSKLVLAEDHLDNVSKAPILEPRHHSDTFNVGALVRVVGRIKSGMYPGADLGIAVDSMGAFENSPDKLTLANWSLLYSFIFPYEVELRDSNLEAQHHIDVERLHREVYSQTFDLDAQLELVRAEERATEQAWDGRSQASSEAGSPRKRKRYVLPNPLSISTTDLTLQNFIPYITSHILSHSSSSSSSQSSPPSPSSTSLRYGSSTSTPYDAPRSFTLASLESSRTLTKFASRLSQKTARDKIEKKRLRDRPKPLVVKTWAANGAGEGGYVRSGIPGMRGGSAKILPPAGQKKLREKGKEKEVEENVLEGDALLRATHKVFCEALKRMRAKGEIVVLAPEEVEQLPEVGLSPLKFDTSYEDLRGRGGIESREQRQGKGGKTNGIFDLHYALDDTEPSSGRRIAVASTPQRTSHRYQLNYAPEDDDNPRPYNHRPPSPNKGRTFELRYAEDEDTTADSTPKGKVASRSGPSTLRFADDPPSPHNTPRPLPLSSVLPTNSITPRPTPFFQTPPRPKTTTTTRSPGQESWTTSLAAMDTEESYALVTAELLAPMILRFVNNLRHNEVGLDEMAVRRKLLMEGEKWEMVAKESEKVEKAIELLKERGEVGVVGGRMKGLLRTYSMGRR
ncbi:hypothetical protein P7C70_g8106, partial [Phenoliferia sp. Uapishka_3]